MKSIVHKSIQSVVSWEASGVHWWILQWWNQTCIFLKISLADVCFEVFFCNFWLTLTNKLLQQSKHDVTREWIAIFVVSSVKAFYKSYQYSQGKNWQILTHYSYLRRHCHSSVKNNTPISDGIACRLQLCHVHSWNKIKATAWWDST